MGVLLAGFTLAWTAAASGQVEPPQAPAPAQVEASEQEEPNQEQTSGQGEPSEAPSPGDVPWGLLGIAALFGSIGGVVYELIALQGNIEWPHRPVEDELPDGGFGHATLAYVYDLGIVARVFIGAAAAIIVLWVLPVSEEIHLIAVALIAGSAGTAVFRSLQDRLVAALNAAKTDTLRKGLVDVQGELRDLETAAAPGAGGPAAAAAAGAAGAGGAAAQIQAKAASIRGRVEALLKIGSRQ